MEKAASFELGNLLKKILDEAKGLIDCFINKTQEKKSPPEPFFDKCLKIFESLSESCYSYNLGENDLKNENLQKLIKKLNAFNTLLKEECNKNSFSKFFSSKQSFIKNAHAHLYEINFVKIDLDTQIESKFLSKFKNQEAGKIWRKYFQNQEQVNWKIFSTGFMDYAKTACDLDLTEIQMHNILKKIDEDKDLLIRYDEWDPFYIQIWSNEVLRKSFLNKLLSYQSSDINLGKLVLIYKKANQSDKGVNDFKIGNRILITEKETFLEKGNPKSFLKDLENEALVIGRKKKNQVDADVMFSCSSVSAKQFQITAKKIKDHEGFYLNNLSSSNRTSLKLEDTPIVLENLMVFNLNLNLIEIVAVYPPPAKLDSSDPDYHFLNFTGKLKDSVEYDELTKIREKKVKKDPLKPSLTFLVAKEDLMDKANPVLNFPVEFNSKNNFQILVGSGKNCQVSIDDVDDIQIIFEYNANLKCWLAKQPTKTEVSNYLYLIHGSDMNDEEANNQGRLSMKLKTGMTIEFNEHEFLVDLGKK